MALRIFPSLVASSLVHVGQTVAELEEAGADGLHFDVEDGLFVPSMNLGTKIIGDLRPRTQLPFDVHLMVADPERILPAIIQAGANRISVHYEACPYPRRTLQSIASRGVQAGLALNPRTPLPDLGYLSPYLSFVVVLTTEPEMVDSPFLPGMLAKVRAGRGMASQEHIEWVVDGGVEPENIRAIADAGAQGVVAGRAVFRDGLLAQNIAALRAACEST